MDTELWVAVIAALFGALWGVPAVLGWRQVADARKERIGEIEASLARAEEREAAFMQQLAVLESRPDYSEVMGVLSSLKETVDEIAARWG